MIYVPLSFRKQALEKTSIANGMIQDPKQVFLLKDSIYNS